VKRPRKTETVLLLVDSPFAEISKAVFPVPQFQEGGSLFDSPRVEVKLSGCLDASTTSIPPVHPVLGEVMTGKRKLARMGGVANDEAKSTGQTS
jgi:hypothetical protein